MKKLLLACMMLLAIGSSAQIVVNEGFESTTLPTGFTANSFYNSAAAADICTGAGTLRANLYSSVSSGNVVYANSTSNGTALSVSFNYRIREYNAGAGVGLDLKVQYSVDGGTTYTQIGSTILVTAEQACTAFTGTVPTGAIALNANFKFRILATRTAGDFYISIDDLILQQVVSCAAPSAATISSITTNTANLSWTAASAVPAAGYEVYYSTANTPPNIATVANATNITATTYTITGLLPATNYYIFVRSRCSSSDQSNWIAAPVILTPCVAVTSFSENFDTTSTSGDFLPVCWEKIGSTGYTNVQTGTIGSAPNVLYLSGSTFGGAVLVKLPQVTTLQLGTYRMKFKLRGAYGTGGKMEVGYLTNPADPTTFTALDSFTANSTTVTENVVINNISAPAGVQNLYFRQAETPGISVFIDDVVYELTPNCAEPTDLLASNLTTNTVDLAWTAPVTPPAAGYEIYYSTSSVVPTAATVPSLTGITAVNTTVTGLVPATFYYAYVRSNCGAEKSPWSYVKTFTSACVPITTLPWTENFDAIATIGAGLFPPCWTSQGNYTSQNAGGTSYNDPRSAPNYLTIYYPTSAAYLWTPGFALTAGQSYDFSFYWAGDNTSGWNGDILVNNAQLEAGSTNVGGQFVTGSTTTVSTYNQVTRTFVPTTSGTYYFGIKTVTSSFAPYYMGFDDFKLEQTPNCSEPSNVAVAAITTNSATLTWSAPATPPANGYQYVIGTVNTPPAGAGTATTATTVPLSGLIPETTYYAFVRSMCAGGQSTWASISFITPPVPPVNDACATAIAASATVTTPYTNTQNAAAATNNAGFIDCDGDSMNDGVWYSITGDGTTYTVAISDISGSWDPAIGIYSGNCGATACVDTEDTNGTDENESISFPTVSGVNYLINIGAYSGFSDQAEGTFTITVSTNGTLGTADSIKKDNKLTIYPNPFTDFIRISDVKDVVSISIVDLSGRLVKTVKPAREIQLGDLKTGMYLINLKMKDGSVQTVKAIKK